MEGMNQMDMTWMTISMKLGDHRKAEFYALLKSTVEALGFKAVAEELELGFRAPRVNDMVSRFADQLLAAMDPELFYRDAGQAPATHPGEIRRADLDRALGQLQAALDQAQDSAWFGELVTEPRYDCTPDGAQLRRALQRLGGEPAAVELHAAAKLAWQADPDGILAFANGDSARFDAGVRTALERLCGDWVLDGRTLRDVLDDAEGRRLLEYLLHSGCIDVR